MPQARGGRFEENSLVSDFARFYMLTILYEGPAHGYDVMKTFEERVGHRLSPGIVYPFLQLLEEKGYADSDIDMVGEKERRVYRLTEEGVGLANRLFSRFAGMVSTALEPSMDVCAHCGCKIYEGSHREVIDGTEMSFCCVHCANNYKHRFADAGGGAVRSQGPP